MVKSRVRRMKKEVRGGGERGGRKLLGWCLGGRGVGWGRSREGGEDVPSTVESAVALFCLGGSGMGLAAEVYSSLWLRVETRASSYVDVKRGV